MLLSASVKGGVLSWYTSQASFLKFIMGIILYTPLQIFASFKLLKQIFGWVLFSFVFF